MMGLSEMTIALTHRAMKRANSEVGLGLKLSEMVLVFLHYMAFSAS